MEIFHEFNLPWCDAWVCGEIFWSTDKKKLLNVLKRILNGYYYYYLAMSQKVKDGVKD